MARSDEENLYLAKSSQFVDELNAKFYGRYSFPWRPARFDSLLDPDFETVMLNQGLGDWKHGRVAANPDIWVAGCGTNQAAFTALRFPQARVIGSDLSAESLAACKESVIDLGISNLDLRRESINQSQYNEKFDYVICTGVIHHNADPEAALARLAASLKPSGILELMVYNRFHRVITSAFQKAVRILTGDMTAPDFESELEMARQIADNYPARNLMSALFTDWSVLSESALADRLIQPVEYSYTVESLNELASRCGLEILLPCTSSYDRQSQGYSWDLDFKDSKLQAAYASLPDVLRWQVTNLLLFEKSPMLWFYLQRKDSGHARKPETQVCEEFLDTSFVKAATKQRTYLLQENGRYESSTDLINYPTASLDAPAREIVEAADGTTKMRDIFQKLGLDSTFHSVNAARIKLTTPVFPFLKAVAPEPGRPDDEERRLKAEDLQRIKAQRLGEIKRKSVGG